MPRGLVICLQGCAVRFSVEFDSERLTAGGQGKVEPFTDQLGRGLQIVQRWGEKVEIQRTLQVYDDKLAFCVSGHLTNKSNQSVQLESARMLDLSAAKQGWWSLGRLFEVPAAVGYPGTSPPCRPGSHGNFDAIEESYTSSGVLTLANKSHRADWLRFPDGLEGLRAFMHATAPVRVGPRCRLRPTFAGGCLPPVRRSS